MATVRVPVTITAPQAGGPFMNVFHVGVTGFAQDEAENLGEFLSALQAFYTALTARYPANAVIKFGEGMIRDPLGSPEYVDDDPRTVAVGAQSGNVPSTMLAVVVGWRTASASRSGRGRTFLGPLSADAGEADGTPNGATLAAINGAASALVADSSTANGWTLGVLSTKQAVMRDVTGFSVKDRWAYLSSRRA